MSFKRMMVVGAMASALAFTGCQDRRGDDTAPGGAVEQPEGTGGSGNVDSTIPGSSDTLGGVRQDDRPGADLGGTGGSGGEALEPNRDLGNTGEVNEQDSAGSLDHGGTGGSGSINEHDTSLDQGGTGGSGSMNDQGSSATDPSWTGSTDSVDDPNRVDSKDDQRMEK
ncbi:hypothetical protein [Hyalangium gracile]|uniref:hypothetical protein n=1 Tax=Hyalangium gracile TaxID=394092 RepID=UPI001CC9A9AB|nr:hypothetical protein [Hyalangium gracile]